MAEKKPKPAPKQPKPAGEADARALSPKVAVVNAANETIREIQLSPAVFAVSPGKDGSGAEQWAQKAASEGLSR